VSETVEQEITRKNLIYPRVTPADIDAAIVAEFCFTASHGAQHAGAAQAWPDPHYECPKAFQALGLLTFCVLVLRNGFTVTGESACASPENFDAELGRRIARDNAKAKVWPLLGYALKEKLTEADSRNYSGPSVD